MLFEEEKIKNSDILSSVEIEEVGVYVGGRGFAVAYGKFAVGRYDLLKLDVGRRNLRWGFFLFNVIFLK